MVYTVQCTLYALDLLSVIHSLILTSKKYCLPYYMYIKVLSFKLQAEILDRRVLIIEYIHLFTLKPAK